MRADLFEMADPSTKARFRKVYCNLKDCEKPQYYARDFHAPRTRKTAREGGIKDCALHICAHMLYTIVICLHFHLVNRFLILGTFLMLDQRSLSTRAMLAMLELRLDLLPACHKGSLLSGILLG